MAELSNPIRKMGFYAALGFMFFRFSEAHQILAFTLGLNLYVLYIFAIPAIVSLILSGGIRRAFSMRCAWYWLGYLGWLVMCIPFSFWPGGSFFTVLWYVRTEWLTFFLIAGLVMTWRECWIMLNMLALAGLVAVASGRFFSTGVESRVELAFGTYSNSNDFAALLILMVPFLALVLFTPRRSVLVRIAVVGPLIYGIYLILSTGSRGGLVATGLVAIYILAKLPMRLKLLAVAAFSVGGVLFVTALPRETFDRLMTVFSQVQVDSSAGESAQVRREILKHAAVDMITHPVFGVGPGQFGDYTGKETRHADGSGSPGLWYQTHNTYLQVGAEDGLPALAFFLAALGSTFRLLSRVYSRTLRPKATDEIRKLNLAAFCMLISMVGFCTAVFFLSFAYHFHLPAMAGIAMSLAQAAEHEFGIPMKGAGGLPGLRQHAA
jgi:O-antigen ligase